MDRSDVITRLKTAEPHLRALGARSLYLFGSYARDAGDRSSDIDVFVDKETPRSFGLDEFIGIFNVLQALFDVEIDYSTRDGLHDSLRPEIERTALRVF